MSSFKLRDGNGNYMIFVGNDQYFPYTSTSERSSATTFTKFDDSSVYNNNLGYVGIRNESTGRFIHEQYDRFFDDEFVPINTGFAFKFNDDGTIQELKSGNDLRYISYYAYAYAAIGSPVVWTLVYETDPDQTGTFKIDDTSIIFKGSLSFDGIKNHKYINPRLEFAGNNPQDGFDFTCLVKFTPRVVTSGTLFVFRSSSEQYLESYMTGSSCIINFFNSPNQTQYSFPVVPNTTYEVYISSKNDTLNVKLNGVNLTPSFGTSNNPLGSVFYKPILLGAYTPYYDPSYIEDDFYNGDISEFIVYNYFVDYDTIAEKYTYGIWAPFDSNTNTIFKLSKDLYSGQTIPLSGNNIVSSNGITVFSRFTTDNLFEIKSLNFKEFVSGNRLALLKKTESMYTLDYSEKGGLDILFSQDVTLESNTLYNAYVYVTPTGKISGNFFPTEETGKYLFSTPDEYTVSNNAYVYDRLVPETDFFRYGYTGNTSTPLTDGSSALGEYVNIDLNRKLSINKISSVTTGTSQPSLVHYGSDDGIVYEKWVRNKPYTNIRTIVEESVPKLINGNYVIEYTSNGNPHNMYEYGKTNSATCFFNQINGSTIAGHYGLLPVNFKGLSFPRVEYTNLESVIFNDEGKWKCRVYSTQTTIEDAGRTNRIYNSKFLQLTNSVVVYGRCSDVPTIFEDSSGSQTQIPNGYRSYIACINNDTGILNWIVFYSSTGGDYMDIGVYQPDGTILIYTQSGTLIDSTGKSTYISTNIASPVRLTKDGVFIDYASIPTYGTFNLTSCFDDYGSYYIGGFTQSYGGTVYNSDGTLSSVGLGNGGGGFRAFLIKYDVNGFAQWSFYEPYSDIGTLTFSSASKGSKVYMGLQLGNSRSSAIFTRNGEGNYTLPDDGLPDDSGRFVIIELNLDGYPQNYFMISNQSETDADIYPTGLVIDDDGSFYAWRSSVDSVVYAFDAGCINSIGIVGGNKGSFSVLVKYDADGKIAWTQKFYTHDNDFINDVKIRGSVLDVCTSHGSKFAPHPGYGMQTIIYTLNKINGKITATYDASVSKLPGYNTPSAGTSYWEVHGLSKKYANVTADNSSNVSVFLESDKDYSKYILTFTGETNVYGLESYVPEDSFPGIEDTKIVNINITPLQLKTRVSSNVTKTQTILGANFEARARGEQSLSTLFDSTSYGRGYRFIDSYDGLVTPTSNIILDWTLYGSETININSTGEARLYVDGNLAIDVSGSNTCSPNQLHACKLVYTQNTLGIPYISLTGISNAYALKPDSIIYTTYNQSTFYTTVRLRPVFFVILRGYYDDGNGNTHILADGNPISTWGLTPGYTHIRIGSNVMYVTSTTDYFICGYFVDANNNKLDPGPYIDIATYVKTVEFGIYSAPTFSTLLTLVPRVFTINVEPDDGNGSTNSITSEGTPLSTWGIVPGYTHVRVGGEVYDTMYVTSTTSDSIRGYFVNSSNVKYDPSPYLTPSLTSLITFGVYSPSFTTTQPTVAREFTISGSGDDGNGSTNILADGNPISTWGLTPGYTHIRIGSNVMYVTSTTTNFVYGYFVDGANEKLDASPYTVPYTSFRVLDAGTYQVMSASNVYDQSDGFKITPPSSTMRFSGYAYNNKNVNITRVGDDFIPGLRWSLYDGFSFNDPNFYTTNTPFAQGTATTFNFNLSTSNPPFPTGTRFKIKDTVTGNYIGLNESTTTIETSSTNAITFEAYNDPSIYNNYDGGIALKAVAGPNFDNQYLRHAGYIVYSTPFDFIAYDFSWKFIPTGAQDSFYLYNWFGGGWYLDYNGTNTLISTNFPPRVWRLEFESSSVTSLTNGTYVQGPRSNSVQWSGYFTADEDGVWQFDTSSNCFLTIGTTTVGAVNNPSSLSVTLENAKTYPFVVQRGLQPKDDTVEFTYKRQSNSSIQKDWTGLINYVGPQTANLVFETSTGSVYINAFSVSNVILPDGDYTLTIKSTNWNTDYFILDGFSSYVKLSNVANIYYTKYSSGTIETPFVLNGNSACFSDIVKYTGNVYVPLKQPASGGTRTGPINNNGKNYYIHVFTTSGTFTVPNDLKCDLLVVGGGGGGGFDNSGGGGAGGYLLYSDTLTGTNAGNSILIPTGSYSVNVGAGGNGATFSTASQKGGNSEIVGVTQIAFGGGAANGNSGTAGMNGGSGAGGGGGGYPGSGGTGVAGQGNAGGTSNSDDGGRRHGGGGGAGGVGGDGGIGDSYTGGNGGIGIQNDITGTMTYYAGGGGGGGHIPGTGGLGGGGNAHGGNGTDGFGGGGGGSSPGGGYGGNGGDGIVIIRYSVDYEFSNTINLDTNFVYDEQSNAYTLTLKKQFQGANTYIYDETFRSVLNESNVICSNLLLITSSFATGTSSIGGGPSSFVNTIVDGNFVAPETGTYNVYQEYDSYSFGTNNVYDTNRMTYTIFGAPGVSTYTFEKDDTVPYSINYYHTINPASYADLKLEHIQSGNVYLVSNLTFSDVYRTKISNFYKTTTADANYDIIETNL